MSHFLAFSSHSVAPRSRKSHLWVKKCTKVWDSILLLGRWWIRPCLLPIIVWTPKIFVSMKENLIFNCTKWCKTLMRKTFTCLPRSREREPIKQSLRRHLTIGEEGRVLICTVSSSFEVYSQVDARWITRKYELVNFKFVVHLISFFHFALKIFSTVWNSSDA